MRAIQVSATGGPEVLRSVDVVEPTPGAAQIAVRVGAIGINFIDTYLRSGLYPTQTPYIPGSEGAGVVVAVGRGVDDSRIGERVAWSDAPSSYAEVVIVAAARAVPVPDGITDSVAASVLLQGMTAHYLLDGSAHPRGVTEDHPGDTILLHAGAGGVGLVLTQMAAARGIRVITTVSTDAKEELSRSAGAWEVLRYSDDVPGAVRDLTDGLGVAVAYDGVGADTFEQSLRSTRVRGTVVLFGAASGPVPPFDLQRLNRLGSLSVTRPTLTNFVADDDEFAWRSSEVMAAVSEGRVKVRVGGGYALADAEQAHRDLEARATWGSVVLIP